MRNKRLKIINSVLLLSIFFAVAWYIIDNYEQFTSIEIIDPLWIVPAVLLSVSTIYTIGILTELAVEPHGVKLQRSEIFGLSALNRFGNYVSPGYMGAFLRSAYLKKSYGLSFAKFSSSFIVSSLVQFLISGVILIFTFFIAFNTEGVSGIKSFGLVIVALLVFVSILLMPTKNIKAFLLKISTKNKLVERLVVVADGLKDVRSQHRIIHRMVYWVTLTILASTFATYSLYELLGEDISIYQALFIASLANWSIIFSITPANIGIKESLMIFAANIANVNIPSTLVVAFLLRLIGFTAVAILAGYYAPRLLEKPFSGIIRGKSK